jgi:hypothetical protein
VRACFTTFQASLPWQLASYSICCTVQIPQALLPPTSFVSSSSSGIMEMPPLLHSLQ